MPPTSIQGGSRLALVVLLAACEHRRAPPDDAVAAVAASTPSPVVFDPPSADPLPDAEPDAPPPGLVRWLQSAAVDDEAYARTVLYSWTSDATEARLRQERTLFDDNQLPEGATPYVQRLQHAAAQDNTSGRLAKLFLGHPDLARRRYAWSRPWPTRLGLVRPYGGRLIAAVLEPSALIGRFDPSLPQPWEFRDLDQRRVPLARVLADPSSVAAIYHVRRDAKPYFREYVLCNESALASWSLATPQLRDVLAEDARWLRTLAALVSTAVVPAYRATLAFDVPRYAPTPRNLLEIANSLRPPAKQGRPLKVVPRRRFRRRAKPGLVETRTLPPRLEFVA